MTTAEATTATRRAEFWAGVRGTFPLVVGAVPFGIIFGANAVTGGLSPAGTMAMSVFVFAGSAQFIAAGLVASGVNVGIIILTTFIVNLRHALYSATLAPHMKHLPQRWLVPLGFWLTDESFVVVVARYNKPDVSPYKHWYFLGSALFMYTNWQVCTYIGLIIGQTIPSEQVSNLGLKFAATVTFMGMLIPMLRSRPALLAAIVSGGSAVLLKSLPEIRQLSGLELIIGALLGVAVAVIAEAQLRRANPVSPAVPNPEKTDHE